MARPTPRPPSGPLSPKLYRINPGRGTQGPRTLIRPRVKDERERPGLGHGGLGHGRAAAAGQGAPRQAGARQGTSDRRYTRGQKTQDSADVSTALRRRAGGQGKGEGGLDKGGGKRETSNYACWSVVSCASLRIPIAHILAHICATVSLSGSPGSRCLDAQLTGGDYLYSAAVPSSSSRSPHRARDGQ